MNINKENILWNKKKIFDSITPFTLLDYQGVPSAILWFSGCNMRCDFCYNPEIVLGKGKYAFDEIESFLATRRNLLQGVVLCGGEPTIYNELYTICKNIKAMGFKIKLDTNGLKPKMIQHLVQNRLVDCIALDFKAPKEKFKGVTKSDSFEAFEETLRFLLRNSIEYEIRTTFSQVLLSLEDIYTMILFLVQMGYTKNYYLQNFLTSKETLGNIKTPNSLNLSQIIKQDYLFEIKFRNF